jgi:hypothetical protein
MIIEVDLKPLLITAVSLFAFFFGAFWLWMHGATKGWWSIK